jgi:hypothetical protein
MGVGAARCAAHGRGWGTGWMRCPPEIRRIAAPTAPFASKRRSSHPVSLQCMGCVRHIQRRTPHPLSQTIPGATTLAEGSVLCLADRTPLGRVEDVFGPVVLPFYALRHYSGGAPPPNVTCGVSVFSVDRYAETLVPTKLKSKGYAAPQCATHSAFCAEENGAAEQALRRTLTVTPTPHPPATTPQTRTRATRTRQNLATTRRRPPTCSASRRRRKRGRRRRRRRCVFLGCCAEARVRACVRRTVSPANPCVAPFPQFSQGRGSRSGRGRGGRSSMGRGGGRGRGPPTGPPAGPGYGGGHAMPPGRVWVG